MTRYDLGDNEYYWFNIPFRGDGLSFVRGDTGAGISSDEARLNIAGASELEKGKILCTLLIDVGCSVVVPSETKVENVARSKMWGLHLGMLKCVLTFPDCGSGGAVSPLKMPVGEGDAGAGGLVVTPPVVRDDDGLEETKSPRRNSRMMTAASVPALSVAGGGFFDEIPSLRSFKFWWCCGNAKNAVK